MFINLSIFNKISNSSVWNIIDKTYILSVCTDIVSGFRVIGTFCQPSLDGFTVSGGMIIYATAKTTRNVTSIWSDIGQKEDNADIIIQELSLDFNSHIILLMIIFLYGDISVLNAYVINITCPPSRIQYWGRHCTHQKHVLHALQITRFALRTDARTTVEQFGPGQKRNSGWLCVTEKKQT